MPVPAPNTLAIIGAGPIGLEAAARAQDAGFDVHVFERGVVGSHPIGWGHVRLFTPWRMLIGPAGRARLSAAGWAAPDPEAFPTGRELAERYLEPLARLPELQPRIHTHAQVVHVSRAGLLKADQPGGTVAGRRARPFRLLVRDQGGRENFLHAFALIDASGVYAQPNWAGDGGIPARNEIYLAPQMSYHVDDVLGLRRERYAGRRVLVIGGGDSAATVVMDLLRLADEAPGTAVAWATRKPAAALYRPSEDEATLPGLRALMDRARGLLRDGHPAVSHVGGVTVEGFEYNSATHRYRVALTDGETTRIEEADQVIVNAGYGPDDSIYRELQVHECYSSRGPMRLAAALQGSTGCTTTPSFGADALSNPEPDFYILGHKSYGRTPHFLMETGYRQVEEAVAKLAVDRQVAVGQPG
jgi:cation diffusion facilitator CzcD-associated flavoprotein CzcO